VLDYPIKTSYQASTFYTSGANTWHYMVIDLGANVGTYSTAYFYQTFSDGKVTHVNIAFSDYSYDYSTFLWSPGASVALSNTNSGPAATISFSQRSQRYVRVGMRNDGSLGNPSYVELFSFKLF